MNVNVFALFYVAGGFPYRVTVFYHEFAFAYIADRVFVPCRRVYRNVVFFIYSYQRPPSDCVKVKPPTLYWVTITDFSYEMSDSDYKAYEGLGNADIQMVWKIGGDSWENIGDYSKEKSRSVSTNNGKKIAFWFFTDGRPLTAGIVDADTFDRGPDRTVEFEPSQFSRSGDESYTFDSGTKISIRWTTK